MDDPELVLELEAAADSEDVVFSAVVAEPSRLVAETPVLLIH